MGRLGFLFTITGFWLRRMALALRMAAWRRGGLRSPPLGACAPHPVFPERRSCSTVTRGPPLAALPRCPRPARLAQPAPLTIRKSGRYLFFRIMCRMLLRVARAFLLMVVRT